MEILIIILIILIIIIATFLTLKYNLFKNNYNILKAELKRLNQLEEAINSIKNKVEVDTIKKAEPKKKTTTRKSTTKKSTTKKENK